LVLWYSCVQDDVVFGAPNLVKYWQNVVSCNKWLDMFNEAKRFCNGRDNNIPRSMDSGCFNHHRALYSQRNGNIRIVQGWAQNKHNNLFRVRI
jgi:hypothetical protein